MKSEAVKDKVYGQVLETFESLTIVGRFGNINNVNSIRLNAPLISFAIAHIAICKTEYEIEEAIKVRLTWPIYTQLIGD